MKPVLTLVGRPNVGKSTLFNRLTHSRDALVADFAGLTRDRHYGNAEHAKTSFLVVDTGGFEPDAREGVLQAMAQQTRLAVAEADVVGLVVDLRAGINAQDHEIARYLRRQGKSCVLIANKAEGLAENAAARTECHELGLGEVHAISAAHGQGVRALLESVTAKFPVRDVRLDLESTDQPGAAQDVIRLAVAGRPNAGKSTLINTWLGEERLVAFDMPGTTRDAIMVPFEHHGQKFELVDTAGLRKRGKVFEAIEKFSVIKTLQAIAASDVVVLLIDATAGVTDQDAHIGGYLLENGRAVVLAINKWDAVDAHQRQMMQRALETRLPFLRFARVHTISARKRQGLEPLWKSIIQAHAAAYRKLPTPMLTRLLQEAVQYQSPQRQGGYRPKLRYAHQGGVNPPRIVIHGNALDRVGEPYVRYLEGRFRKAFDLTGTPLRIEFKSSSNPYDTRD